MQERQGVTQAPRGGQAGMKSILENMPELWSEEQYASEYDLSSFMQSLAAANKKWTVPRLGTRPSICISMLLLALYVLCWENQSI